jgi:hypothetical protein
MRAVEGRGSTVVSVSPCAIAYGRRVRAMLAAAVEGFNPSTARRLARVSRNAWALPLACAVVDDWGLGSGLCMGEEET